MDVAVRIPSGRAGASLERRFALAYRGPHAPADALHWIEHPDDRGPTGAEPPRAAASALRRVAYGADPVAAGDAVGRLRELLDGVAADRAEALRALRVAAGAGEPAGPPVAPRRAVLVPTRGFLAAVVAALVLGAVAGGASALLPGAAPAATGPERVGSTLLTTVPETVLARGARSAADRTTAVVGSQLLPGSLRFLATVPGDGTGLFAARDRFHDTCLVAARDFVQSACVPAAAFRTTGVQLVWAAETIDGTMQDVAATWRPDGRVELRGVPL